MRMKKAGRANRGGIWPKFGSTVKGIPLVGNLWRNLSNPLAALLHASHWLPLGTSRVYRKALFDSAPEGSILLSTTGHETYLVSAGDKVIGRRVFIKGSFEFENFETAISLLSNDFQRKLLIDVGANIGVVCIPAIKRQIFQSAIAIEPEPFNYSLLASNIHLNNLGDRITPHNCALGSRDGQELRFELSQSNYGDHRVRSIEEPGLYGEEKRRTIKVKSETFDSLIADIQRNEALIWMDAQGYEGIILAGATKALEKKIPLVIEFWPYGMKRVGAYAAVKKAILGAGYEIFHDLNATLEPQQVSEASLDALFNRLGISGNYADLLIT